MPIDYNEYPRNWHEISRYIRQVRAGNRCEWCEKPNGESVVVSKTDAGAWLDDDENVWRDSHGDIIHPPLLTNLGWRQTRVVLTTAHLNHKKHDTRHENLAALCQACHLRYDLPRHIRNRKYGRGHDGPHQGRLGFLTEEESGAQPSDQGVGSHESNAGETQ